MKRLQAASETPSQAAQPAVPLSDTLGTIRKAVQAEVNLTVGRLADQQQQSPHQPSLPPTSPLIPPVTSG